MKRILCILSGMNAGGAETFLMKIYRNIDRTKYQMDFCINVKEKCYYEDEIVSKGGKIYRIPSKTENLKEFRQQLFDVVRSNSYHYVLRITSSAMGFMDLKIAKKAGAHVCCARSSNSSDGSGIISKIAHFLGRIFYSKYVDIAFAPSDLAAKYTFGKNAYRAGKVHVLRNGVDLGVFRYRTSAREKVRSEFGISNDAKVIGHIGRFAEQKNHEFIIKIFKQIQNIDDNTVLFLVGEGVLEEKIKQMARSLGIFDRVIFAGVRSDISDILSAMDAFVFPSLYEGMPNTVIEAQATGLGSIIADTITREADITGLVQYLSLKDSELEWAKKTMDAAVLPRRNTVDDFKNAGYDIKYVAKEFVSLMRLD